MSFRKHLFQAICLGFLSWGFLDRAFPAEESENLARMQGQIDTLLSEGKYAEADTQLRALLEAQERLLGPEDAHTLASRRALADALSNRGNPKEAETEYRKLLEVFTRQKGADNNDVLNLRGELARVLGGLEHDYPAALKEYRAIYDVTVKKYGRQSNAAVFAQASIANAIVMSGDHKAGGNEYKKLLNTADMTISKAEMEIRDKQHELEQLKETVSRYYYHLSLELEYQQQFSEALSYAQLAERDYLQRYGKDYRVFQDAKKLRERLEKELQDLKDGKIVIKSQSVSAAEWGAKENSKQEAMQWEWHTKAWQNQAARWRSGPMQLKLQVASPKQWPQQSSE